MIRVTKPACPAYLARVAPAATKALVAARASGRSAKADPDKYGHKNVRDALSAAQHGKCCYCEVWIPKPYAHGHVEHYRPKGTCRQDRSSASMDGYYWLAYTWTNLYLSCSHCNSSYKSDLFPLADETKRAKGPSSDLADEQPLLLDPGGVDDPEDHIGFHDEVPVGRSEKGRTTVQAIGLDCIERGDRLEHLNSLRRLHREIGILRNAPGPEFAALRREKLKELLISGKPDQPYSALSRSFLRVAFKGKGLARPRSRRRRSTP